jgi:hypothetical protein
MMINQNTCQLETYKLNCTAFIELFAQYMVLLPVRTSGST